MLFLLPYYIIFLAQNGKILVQFLCMSFILLQMGEPLNCRQKLFLRKAAVVLVLAANAPVADKSRVAPSPY